MSSLKERIGDVRLRRKIGILMSKVGLADTKPTEITEAFLKKLKYLNAIRTYPGISKLTAREFVASPSSWKPKTNLQRLGLKYGPRINRNLDRGTVERTVRMLKLRGTHYIVGSYRRGKEFGIGDIDILIGASEEDIEPKLKKRLGARYIATMVTGPKKISFLAKIPGKSRQKYPNDVIYPPSSFGDLVQIDIRFIHKASQLPFLLLYFTGSREFSIKSRIKAIEMGLKLNEYGLFHKKSNNPIKKILRTERSIIRHLNLDKKYYNPINR